jgi:hypothetical protein
MQSPKCFLTFAAATVIGIGAMTLSKRVLTHSNRAPLWPPDRPKPDLQPRVLHHAFALCRVP